MRKESLYIYFVAICVAAIMGVDLIPERVKIKYVNPKYVANVTGNVRRLGRGSPYYLNIGGTTLQPWYNNVSVQFKFSELLSNDYRESFVDITLKYCDFMKRTRPFIGHIVKRIGLDCPLKPGRYLLYNLTSREVVAVKYKFPFNRGMMSIFFRTEPAKELMAERASALPFRSDMRGRAPAVRCAGAGAAGLLGVAALALALAWNAVFDAVLASQLALTPTSRAFNDWLAPSVPLYFEIFLFNWTNAERFPEEKPHLEQIGPFRFLEKRRHVNVTWHNHNGSIAYRTLRQFFFDPKTSNGTLQDNITTINAIAASAVYRSRYWGFLRQKGLSLGLAMFGQHISVTKSAGELLFEGYVDDLLDMAKSLPSSTTGGAPKVDRFGWFYERNNSIESDGYMEVSTGVERGTLPGQVLRWNGEDHIPYYSGKCSELAGSAGEFLPRNLTETSQLTMFVPDLCRTVRMDYLRSGELEGLPYHTYAMSRRSFDNSSLSPSNTCFCNGECAWGGVMNVSACRFGSPAFITLPHFLHGDPALHNMVTGLRPDPEKHEFYFSAEPQLGIPLEVAARFQLNMLLEPSPNIALYEDVPRMLFPILWVQQKVTIADKELITELRAVRAILDWGGTVCAGAALFFASIVVALATCCQGKPKYSTPRDSSLDKTSDKPKDEAEMKLNPK